ncbi:MAG: RNA polymerase sigma factor [Myxococcales bacterium]|nr:RNA polymerase sigma factor [Myxococcales bacterium]
MSTAARSLPAQVARIVRLVTLPPKALAAVGAEVSAERARELAVEQALAERARAGDRPAIAAILRKYGPILYRSVLLPRLGSEAAAQDALADTYVRVVERFGQFEWRGCGIYPWLRVVALRIALDALRARKRETLFLPEDLERAADAAERDLDRGMDVELWEKRDREAAKSKLEHALGQINSRYATAIRLRVLEEKSREDAARALEVSVGTLDVVLHRALKALKKALGHEDGELLGGTP